MLAGVPWQKTEPDLSSGTRAFVALANQNLISGRVGAAGSDA